MTFVHEPMSLDNWKELVHLNPNGMYPSGVRDHWVVDHDNDVQLVSLGGRGHMPASSDHMPNFYVLIWHKPVVKFESRYTSKIDDCIEGIEQEIFSIYAPKKLAPEAEAIRTAIQEALLVNWQGLKSGLRLQLGALSINFSEMNFV
jgi:hypothetical protein